MKNFKIALIAAACAVTLSTAALASSGWEGPYAGVDVGAGFANGKISDPDCWGCNMSNSFTDAFAQAGVTGGYNHLVNPNTLLGLEAEATYGSSDHKATWGETTETGHSKVDWTLALLARAGAVNGDSLFYVEGGPALANWDAKGSVTGPARSWDASGWTPAFKAGLGTEWMIGNGLSARAQYNILILQDQIGNLTPSNCVGGEVCREQWSETQHTVTVGVTKHF
jgi:opacity protein-like surface antigen